MPFNKSIILSFSRSNSSLSNNFEKYILTPVIDGIFNIEASKEAVDATDLWEDTIITTIEPLTNYYKAENYHQDYFENNPTAGYCSFVIAPKVQKFKKEFAHLLKEDNS